VLAPAPRVIRNRSQLMGFTKAGVLATALATSACSVEGAGGVDASNGGPFDAGMDDAEIRGGVDAAYGGPPFDAGLERDASTQDDAGTLDDAGSLEVPDGAVIAAYGAPAYGTPSD
jgi:hypothetical protein